MNTGLSEGLPNSRPACEDIPAEGGDQTFSERGGPLVVKWVLRLSQIVGDPVVRKGGIVIAEILIFPGKRIFERGAPLGTKRVQRAQALELPDLGSRIAGPANHGQAQVRMGMLGVASDGALEGRDRFVEVTLGLMN